MSKYKFVYDTELNDIMCHLSEEEITIVLATVLGKHNAIFYGYKPERLVKAISRLSETPVEELINFDSDTRLQVNLETSTEKQYIATSSGAPYSTILSARINMFDVMYKCKEMEETFITYGKLKESLTRRIVYRKHWDSSQYIMGKTDVLKNMWFSSDCFTQFENKKPYDRFAIKKIKFARSLADAEGSCVAYVRHLRFAENVFNYKDPDETQMPF